jgi:DNA transposition AAA+ family ATPase
MNSPAVPTDFIVTKEHRCFAEFCDACRRDRYIGLCYGPPGVGKTLSARHYADWYRLEAYHPYTEASAAEWAGLLGSATVFYTPSVVNSPGRIAQDIQLKRHTLRTLALEQLYREEEAQQLAVQQQEAALRRQLMRDLAWRSGAPCELPTVKPTVADLAKAYAQKRQETRDPTSLVIIDEADRLKTASLEQMRDIFDGGELGVVLIGMPGLEKRLSRYPQLYSRVGFVHAFRPLSAAEVRQLLESQWLPSGVALPKEGLSNEETRAAIIRTTGGNFRLLQRLLTQMARLVEINALSQVTREVVEAAREALVIGVN